MVSAPEIGSALFVVLDHNLNSNFTLVGGVFEILCELMVPEVLVVYFGSDVDGPPHFLGYKIELNNEWQQLN